MRIPLFAAAVAMACFAAPAVTPAKAAGYDQQYAMACAPGYHNDRQGNCQPDVAEVNRYCPPGAIYHPWIDGNWYCETPQGNIYY